MVGFSRCYALAGFGQIVFLWPDLYALGLDVRQRPKAGC